MAEAGDTADNPIEMAIDTGRGLWVAACVQPAACDVASPGTTPQCVLPSSATEGSDAREPLLTVIALP